jgi:putative SOS response-associated peptidase YedK
MTPIVRNGADGERELVMARWSMPGPPQFGGAPITNIRNVGSPDWRGWLGKRHRCIVPATSFCQYADTKPRKTPKWFALGEDRPLFAFAGLWTLWRGVRGPKSASVDGQHELFGFLTTEPNAVVAPIHPKAMPVILTTPGEVDLSRRRRSNCKDHCPTMRCESSRAVKRKMARAKTQRLAGIKTQCSRFDALRRFQPYPGAIRSHKLRPSRAGSLILYRSERPLPDWFPALTSRMMSSPMGWALAESVIILAFHPLAPIKGEGP